jgi:hypothetical protein
MARAKVCFSIAAVGESRPEISVTPSVDSTSLGELVAAFEAEQHFEPAGGYGGLIPQFFNHGSFDRYLLGEFDEDSYWARRDGIYLLGCSCGEVGCWPLLCKVEVDGGTVTWSRFRQPHRPDRDYSQFGPFVFDADQYREVVAALSAELSARLS